MKTCHLRDKLGPYTHGHLGNGSVDAQWHNNGSQDPRQTGRVVDSLLRDLLPGQEVEKCGAAALRRAGIKRTGAAKGKGNGSF